MTAYAFFYSSIRYVDYFISEIIVFIRTTPGLNIVFVVSFGLTLFYLVIRIIRGVL